jgi:ABC-2 type transport system permease protein
MFWEIFRFEIQNKLRRPAIYIYLVAIAIFTIGSFATVSLPIGEKQHVNSPQMIAFFCAAMSMMTTLVSSSIMGMSLYRDIEFSTKDYYLTYPITKPGYFWGRFASSFFYMLLLGAAIPLSIFIGTKLGPVVGRADLLRFGPNYLSYYLQPFCTIILPNLLFTSCLFYGLVAVTRNVKVVYTGGIVLFLGYFISVFFFNNGSSLRAMILWDPFLITGTRLQMANSPSLVQNTQMLAMEGDYLLNRLIWSGLGVLIVLLTYWRFNFERFFSGKKDKAAIDEPKDRQKATFARASAIDFSGSYNRRTLYQLVSLETRNILRDNYFWIIIVLGAVALGFSFSMPPNFYGVDNFPRTIDFLNDFDGTFIFFVFFIILFYTGETLHRDQATRYAYVNDSLPPPNWVINGSKLLSLLILGAFLSILPLVVGVVVQLLKDYHHFNFPIYFAYIGVKVLPRLEEMVLFCYVVHVVINNKFGAHGVAAVLWIGGALLQGTKTFDYHLLVYPYGPETGIPEMDGMGHMVRPILWFHGYWLLFGGLLIIVAALCYHRGVSTSLRERLQLVPERFNRVTRSFTAGLLVAFLAVGGWLYYNVSFLNDYLTKGEIESQAVVYERALKHYDTLPLPVVTRYRLNADLYPEKQEQRTRGTVTLLNASQRPITTLLLDADDLSEYSLSMQGQPISYTQPLLDDRAFFGFFRSRYDTAPFRLYTLPHPIAPGDTADFEVSSVIRTPGIPNGSYGENMLRNGFFFSGGLPNLGYDEGDEISSPYLRRKNHLPPKPDDNEIPQDDPIGIRTLKAGNVAHLMSIDLTISTAGDQTAIGQGALVKKWQEGGRNYFHYKLDNPGSYPPITALSARYTRFTDSVELDHKIYINIFYDSAHKTNIQRFIAGYKDALRYYSQAYGPYPYNSISLAESSPNGPRQGSTATLDFLPDYYGWNAHFTNPDQFDYCYYSAARLLAQQWWRFQVAPNETQGSMDIPEGLSHYDGLVMAEHKYGKDNVSWLLRQETQFYGFLRRRQEDADVPLIRSKYWFIWEGKAAVALYGLRDLIGEDSMNAALRQFKNEFANRATGPYAGANDLYRCLKAHTPDSVQYYLTDTWLKITLYDNQTTSVSATPTGKPDEYKVVLNVHVGKTWSDEKGREADAKDMADYIDIGVFGAGTTNKVTGRGQTNPLFLHKYKLSAGNHTFTLIVHGKPEWAGIDPYGKLLDVRSGDNSKSFTH